MLVPISDRVRQCASIIRLEKGDRRRNTPVGYRKAFEERATEIFGEPKGGWKWSVDFEIDPNTPMFWDQVREKVQPNIAITKAVVELAVRFSGDEIEATMNERLRMWEAELDRLGNNLQLSHEAVVLIENPMDYD